MKSATPFCSRKRPNNFGQKPEPEKEALKVFCRVRPIASTDITLTICPPNQIKLTPPASSCVLRNGAPKATLHTFKQVFAPSTSQTEIFTRVALPLVRNVLYGRSCLLLAYGVTGSGKTYTMTGPSTDPGIVPRCLDVVFNSVSNFQAKRFTFKPDRTNGFDVQTEDDVKFDVGQAHLTKTTLAKRVRTNPIEPGPADPSRPLTDNLSVDVVQDNLYSVFVSFVEIYNNSVFDLLEDAFDDSARSKPLQTKILREDSNKNVFVHGGTELEVGTAYEAYEVFLAGQKRRRIAQTALNAESSRSHSVFTIRVVQAPLNVSGDGVVTDKNQMTISQLSLTDLAGSERTNRTNNTGKRLREAGNINNSLLTLRTCLELLRENQAGANKVVPYRDSRITHLFKGFLEGEGNLSMIICVNPHPNDFDETAQVLKFAEASQELQVSVPIKTTCYTPGRKRAIEEYEARVRRFENRRQNTASSDAFFCDLPDCRSFDFIDANVIRNAKSLFERDTIDIESHMDMINEKAEKFKAYLIASERQSFLTAQEVKALKSLHEKTTESKQDLEIKFSQQNEQLYSLKRKLQEVDSDRKKLKSLVHEKDVELGKQVLAKEKTEEKWSSKIQHTEEKMSREFERKLRAQKMAIESKMKDKENRLKAVKKILKEGVPTKIGGLLLSKSEESLRGTFTKPELRPVVPVRPSARKIGTPSVAIRRHRRSKSTGIEDLERPALMHPSSKLKLTDAACLTVTTDCTLTLSQGAGSPIEDDAEIHKKSTSPSRRPADIRREFEAACARSTPMTPSFKRHC